MEGVVSWRRALFPGGGEETLFQTLLPGSVEGKSLFPGEALFPSGLEICVFQVSFM